MANGSAPINRSRKASNTPSTASAHPSRLASPQPKVPPSASTRTNSQRGGTRKVSMREIFMRASKGKVRRPAEAHLHDRTIPPRLLPHWHLGVKAERFGTRKAHGLARRL